MPLAFKGWLAVEGGRQRLYPNRRERAEWVVEESLNLIHIFLGAELAETVTLQVLLLLIQDDDVRSVELLCHFVDLSELGSERMTGVGWGREGLAKW